MTYAIQIITAALGSLGFSVIFNSKKSMLPVLTAGGAVSWIVYLAAEFLGCGMTVCYFAAGAAATAYAEIFARICKTPATTVLIPLVIPLVPGGMLYRTMKYLYISDFNTFADMGTETLKVATSIVIGIILVSSLMKLVYLFIGKEIIRRR